MRFDLSNYNRIVNKVYYPLLKNLNRYLILYGSAGSGKSWFAAQKILFRIAADADKRKNIKHRFLVLRKTQPAVRKSIYALFSNLLSSWGWFDKGVVKVNKSEMSFNFLNGSQIICGGLDDPEKLKSIEGVTGVWLEEATELNKNDFIQVDLRLRGQTKSYKQIILSFNPISRLSWLYSEFFEKQKNNTFVCKTTYKDNRFIDEEYVSVLEQLKDEDETYYQIYALGEWGVLKNIIYSNYEFIDRWAGNFDELFYGLDFGFNNPSALVEIGVKDQEIYEKELLYEKNLTNADLISRLESLISDKTRNIYADSAEPARIKEIANAGFNIYPANKSVKDGIDFVKRAKTRITKDSINLIKEINGYKYKENKDGQVMDEPVKFMDHLMDARRYAIYTHLGKGKSDWKNIWTTSVREASE